MRVRILRLGIFKIAGKDIFMRCKAFALGLLTAMNVFAGQDTTRNRQVRDTVYDLDKIIISAARRETRLKNTPGMSYVVDRGDLDVVHAHRASDAMGYVPGLDLEGGTGVGLPFKQNVSINGLPSFHNIVLVDGRRLLSSHFHTGTNIDMIPAENIERIEIIKDAASALYGSDALGGVINIITKKGTASPVTEVFGGGASRSTIRGGLSFRGKTNDILLHSTHATWEQSQGLPITEGMRKDDLDFKQLTLMERVDILAGSNARIGLSIDFAQHLDLPWRGNNYDSWLFTPGIDLSLDVNKNLHLSVFGYYSQWNADLAEEKNEIASPQIWLTYKGIPLNVITAGVEYAWRNFARTGVKEQDQHFAAAFVQDELSLFDEKVKLLGALRVDYVENTVSVAKDIGPRLSPRISALVRPVEALSIRAGAGMGFRAPFIQDLYESRFHPGGGGIWRYGNDSLVSEQATNFNAGVTVEPVGGLQFNINGYYNRLKDMIAVVNTGRDTVYGERSVQVMQRRNIHDFTIGGIDAFASYQGEYLGVEAGGNAVVQQSDDDEAKEALLYPGQKIYTRINGRYSFVNEVSLKGFAGVKHIMNRKAPEDIELDDYTDLEMGISIGYVSKYELFFKAKNLLAQQRQIYEDALWTVEGQPFFEGGIKVKAF